VSHRWPERIPPQVGVEDPGSAAARWCGSAAHCLCVSCRKSVNFFLSLYFTFLLFHFFSRLDVV
jgi:hypothetical protein